MHIVSYIGYIEVEVVYVRIIHSTAMMCSLCGHAQNVTSVTALA